MNGRESGDLRIASCIQLTFYLEEVLGIKKTRVNLGRSFVPHANNEDFC